MPTSTDPDVDLGVINHLRPLFPTSGAGKVVITDKFPLDGAFAAPRLVVARTTFATDSANRTLSTVEVTVDVWCPTREEALTTARQVQRALCVRGGFPLVEAGQRTGHVSQGRATLRPIRSPDGDASNTHTRYVATYELTVRNLAAS